jgi:hypothetical protein
MRQIDARQLSVWTPKVKPAPKRRVRKKTKEMVVTEVSE